MHKLLTTFLITLSLYSLVACSQNSDSKQETANISDALTVEPPKTSLYGIEGEEIPIRKGPGSKYDKIVNEKATSALRRTEYCTVDYSVKVEILEKQREWAKIRVIEPDWLSASHVGWIPAKYIVDKGAEDNQNLGKLNASEYEILKTRHNSAVENFHVLLKRKTFDEKSVHQFVEQFRNEHCSRNCNVEVYDSKTILPLIGEYPLPKRDYLKMADHLISISTFDAPEVRDWYPFQDFQYKQYGGRNWKKPIR